MKKVLFANTMIGLVRNYLLQICVVIQIIPQFEFFELVLLLFIFIFFWLFTLYIEIKCWNWDQ